MKTILLAVWIGIFSGLSVVAIHGQDARSMKDGIPTGIGIDEQLGKFVPLKSSFSDEKGSRVALGDLVKTPTILMLVYYNCPNICTPLMEDVRLLTSEMRLRAGVDYNIISISVDENEDPTVAAQKKTEIFKGMKSPIPDDSWRFLTGDKANIAALSGALGFRFKPQETAEGGGVLAHPAALIILSPAGKITRYVMGISYVPADVELALRQAAKGEVTATRPGGDPGMGPVGDAKRFALLCFSYNPEEGKYVLNVTRLVGLLTIIIAVISAGLIAFRGKRRHGATKP